MHEIASSILATIFIGAGVVYFHKTIVVSLDDRQFMVKTMFMILFIMVMLFVVDKLFYANRQLLSKEGREALFEMIKQLLNIMLGFYFGQREK
jgi:Ca2+/Na+ antiporter